MRILRAMAIGLGAFAALTLSVGAADGRVSGKYDSDAAHSSISFRIKHMGLANVQGHFDKFQASFDLNYEHPEKSSVSASVETASVNTANEGRDKHLRTADFFDVEKYPSITFKSTKVKSLGNDKFEVTGDLTMKGITKPVTFTAELVGTMADPKKGEKAGLEASFSIKRTDFGMESSAFLGDDVALSIAFEAARAQPAS